MGVKKHTVLSSSSYPSSRTNETFTLLALPQAKEVEKPRYF